MFTWIISDQLQKFGSDSRIYIIGYAGQQARVNEAQERANWAKEYLNNKKGVNAERIVVIDGGYRDPAGVDLYITPRGQPKPLSSPNVYPGNVQIIKDGKASIDRRP